MLKLLISDVPAHERADAVGNIDDPVGVHVPVRGTVLPIEVSVWNWPINGWSNASGCSWREHHARERGRDEYGEAPASGHGNISSG